MWGLGVRLRGQRFRVQGLGFESFVISGLGLVPRLQDLRRNVVGAWGL